MTEYDVLLCGVEEDREWIQRLIESLKGKGVIAGFVGQSPADQFNQWFSNGFHNNQKLIVVCSQRLFQDRTISELLESFYRQQAPYLKTQRPIIPILLPGNKTIPVVESLIPIDFRDDEDFDFRLHQLNESLNLQAKKGTLEVLSKWFGVDKEFKNHIAEIYRLQQFDVKENPPVEHGKFDLWLEKDFGGYTFKLIVECSEGEPSVRQIDFLKNKYLSAQKQYPGIGCLLVTGKQVSLATDEQLKKIGIRCRIYSELLEELVPLRRYAQKIVRDFEAKQEKDWKGQDWFIRPDVVLDLVTEERHPAWTSICDWLSGKRDSLMAMLGDLGTGKSTLVKFVAYQMARAYLDDPLRHPAPVLIELMETRKEVSFESLIITHFTKGWTEQEKGEFNFARFEYLMKKGRIVLFFDAFDEMAERVRKDVIQKNLDMLKAPSENGAKVMLTCRTHYFRNLSEQEQKVGEGAVYLQEFSEKQVRRYLAKARPQTSDEDWKKIQEIYNLKDLAPRPFLLEIIVAEMANITSINAADLYEKYANRWFEREEKKGRILKKEIKLPLMLELAWKIWDEDKEQIYSQDLLRLVADLSNRNVLDFGDETIEEVAEEIRTASFLKRDKDGNFYFADRSFGEYFLARKIYESLKQDTQPEEVVKLLDTKLLRSKTIFFLEKMFSAEDVHYQLFQQILGSKYKFRISENALQILYWSERIRQGQEDQVVNPEQLRNALEKVIPRGINLHNAKLKSVESKGEKKEEKEKKAIEFIAADFKAANFDGADLTEVDLSYANLEETSFRGAILTKATVESVLAEKADFKEAQISQARFVNSDLTHSDFRGARWDKGTVFENNKTDEAKGLGKTGGLQKSDVRPVIQHSFFGGLQTMAIDPKGELYSCSGQNGLIQIRRIVDDRLLHLLDGHGKRARCLQFSPTSSSLLSGGDDGYLRLWRVNEGKESHAYKENDLGADAVCFSPDGKMFASGGRDKTVSLWSVDTGSIQRVGDGFIGHSYGITALSFSADGSILASGDESGEIRLWDANTGFLFQKFKDAESIGAINCLQFSKNGKLLASGGYDKHVRLWSATNGTLIRVMRGHSDETLALEFSPDNQFLASVGKDRSLRLWSAAERVAFNLTEQAVRYIESLPDKDSIIRMPLVSKPVIEQFRKLIGEEFSTEERLIDRLESKLGKKISQEIKELVLRYSEVIPLLDSKIEHQEWVNCVRFSSEEDLLLSGSGDRQVYTWKIKNKKLELVNKTKVETNAIDDVINRLEGIRSIAVSRNGEFLVSGRENHTICCWKKGSEAPTFLSGHSDIVRGVDLSANGRLIASCSEDQTIRLWDAEDGRNLQVMTGHKGKVTSVHFSSDGMMLASSGEDKMIGIWLASSGQLSNMLPGHYGAVNVVRFSADGESLASGGEDRSVLIWSAKGYQARSPKRLEGHLDAVHAVEFSPNGKLVASGGKDCNVRVWTVSSGQNRRIFDKHHGTVTSLRFFSDNNRLASGSEDGTVRIFNVVTGQQEYELSGHLGRVYSIELSRNDKYLVAAGSAGRLQYWDIEAEKPLLYRHVFNERAWLDLLPDGRFYASDEGMKYLCFTEQGSLHSYSAESMGKDYYDPEAVRIILKQFAEE